MFPGRGAFGSWGAAAPVAAPGAAAPGGTSPFLSGGGLGGGMGGGTGGGALGAALFVSAAPPKEAPSRL
jgi:hypothetical protein